MSVVNEYLKDFGYDNVGDCLQSVIHIKSIKPMLLTSTTFGVMATMFETFLGLESYVYMSFFALLVIEFVTGISASVREKKKISSKRFGRFVFKIIIYTLMIGIVNTLRVSFETSKLGFLYNLIYWTIIHLITVQLVISVFENMSRLGFQESSRIFKAINKLLSKHFDLDSKD